MDSTLIIYYHSSLGFLSLSSLISKANFLDPSLTLDFANLEGRPDDLVYLGGPDELVCLEGGPDDLAHLDVLVSLVHAKFDSVLYV